MITNNTNVERMKNSTFLLPHNVEPADEIKKAFRYNNSILYVSGTGVGKTFVLFNVINRMFRNKKVLYVVPKWVIKYNTENYKEFKIIEKITKSFDFVTYYSFRTPEQSTIADYDFIVIDEAHHLGSPKLGKNIRYLIDNNPDKYFLGLTATPYYKDIENSSNYFQHTINGLSNFQAIDQKLMPPIKFITISSNIDNRRIREKMYLTNDNVIKMLKETIDENYKNKWILYFSSIKEIEEYQETIEKLFPDHKILVLHSKTKLPISMILEKFEKLEKVIICTCSILLEGVHIKGVDGVIIFRNIDKLSVLLQIIGRICTISNNTDNPVIIDVSETSIRLAKKYSFFYRDDSSFILSDDLIKGKNISSKLNIEIKSIENDDIDDIIKNNKFIYNGVKYNSLHDCCNKLGLNSTTVYRFIKITKEKNNNISKQEILDMYIEEKKKKEEQQEQININIKEKKYFIYNDIKYNSFYDCCNKLGLNPKTIYNYIERKQISNKEALDHYLYNRAFEYNDIKYNSFYDCCNKLGLNSKTIYKYIERNKKKGVIVSEKDAIALYLEKQNKLQ